MKTIKTYTEEQTKEALNAFINNKGQNTGICIFVADRLNIDLLDNISFGYVSEFVRYWFLRLKPATSVISQRNPFFRLDDVCSYHSHEQVAEQAVFLFYKREERVSFVNQILTELEKC